MKVLKVINNNVISCLDDRGVETVAMGRGLGFRFKAGMELDPEEAEKIFRMDSPESASRLKDLFSKLPQELLDLCTRIIDYAGGILGRELSESIYLTLTDHIQFAITRSRRNMNFHNALETEVRVFYPEEYAIGSYALQQLNEKLNAGLPQDEAASIALHIINAEYDRTMNATMHAAQLLQPIIRLLQEAPGLALNTASLYYDELLIHIKFMVMETDPPEDSTWEGVSDLLRQRIPRAYDCARSICRYIREQTGREVPESELAYLTISIHRACSARSANMNV